MVNELSSPLDICVLIPCHNNFEGLIDSINSIVYDHQRLMVVVVDDGSATAITRTRLYTSIPAAVNIQLVRLRQNQGITKALNAGLDFIYANYAVQFIARLDCGDICRPDRFHQQIAFLNTHPNIDLLGSWCYFRNPVTGTAYEYRTPTDHEEIERSMYFRNVFVHPTVMWRVAALQPLRYPVKYPHAEDYGLFYDIISKKRTAIISEFLVTCEVNQTGISFLNRSEQLRSRLRVIKDYGRNKLLLAAGMLKLAFLMALPYRLVKEVKHRVYKHTPETMKKEKMTLL
ncbi:MAG TPA: glycosyltransferase [Chitinophagaceae bacterium]|nr:glycosyltransferase [Chitinophagaceae bacterium]